MGARCRPHDRRDREQWHALPALVAGRGGIGAGGHLDCLPGIVWAVHQLDLDSVQVETSGR